MSDEKLYSTKDAAKFLGASIRTLKRWRKSGKLVPEIKGDIQPSSGDTFDETGAIERVTPTATKAGNETAQKSRQSVARAPADCHQTFVQRLDLRG